MELLVGEGAFFAWLARTGGLALPDEGGLVGSGSSEVAVKAVVTDIEPATAEPFRVGFLPLEYFGKGLKPLQLVFGSPAPELFWRTN